MTTSPNQTVKNKAAIFQLSQAFAIPGPQQDKAVADLFSPDAAIKIVHPFNSTTGASGYISDFLASLRHAFKDLHRRDDILLGGQFEGQDWVTTHGNYVGKFCNSWLGLTPSNRLEYLRFGEFFRFENHQIVEAYIYLDIPQLMIATDQWPITESPGKERGYIGMIPGPATQDGLQLGENPADESQKSYQITTDMLGKLATKDEAWRPHWHKNMMWYGPAAFGSYTGIEDFSGFQTPFEGAFSVWSGGSTNNGVTRHLTRFGDGNYSCSAGWPSLMCIQQDRFLGQPSNGDTLLLRVCDWWRRADDLLVENWVFVDIPDVLLQMGVDLFKGHHNVAAGPRSLN